MNETKRTRRTLTDADKLEELRERADSAKEKWFAAQAVYDAALSDAHARAKALAASLPPLPGVKS